MPRSSPQRALLPAGAFIADVTLFDGFNDLQAEGGIPEAVLMVSAPLRKRTILYLPGTVSSYSFSCTIAPNPITVPTERTVDLALTVTATQASSVAWSVVGGATEGTVTPIGQGARYQAPSSAPSHPVTVRASSTLVPAYGCATQVTVIDGISAAATAQVGTPSHAALPSANVGQAVTLSIPAAAFAITQQGFATGQAAVFQTIDRSTTTGQCARSTISVQGTVAPGQTSLSVDVPACADSDQVVRVPGHGTARLLVVPVISSLDLDPTIAPTMLIKGSGFVCGATEILVGGVPVPASQVVSVTCGLIQLGTRPATGSSVQVKTAGGTSNGVSV